MTALTDSPSLVPVLPVNPNDVTSVLLTPGSYGNWASMFAANPAKLDYLLGAGDYRSWGTLELVDQPGGTPDRLKTIRYHDSDVVDAVHPIQRSRSARVDGFRFEGSDTSHWLVQGLTVKRPCKHPAISCGASWITVDLCLIEYAETYSLRIRDASNCTIQRCVIREAINSNNNEGEGDSTGIQIRNIGADISGIRILDNEIYNVGDCIQLTDGPDEKQTIEAVIEGNDLYLEPRRYIGDTNTTWDENAIDLKNGSNAPKSTIIRQNRMWGFRLNAVPTARGEIIVMHRYCRHVVVENNIMGDAPRGMADRIWPPESKRFVASDPRDIVFRGNQFYEIRDYAAGDAGAITKPITAGIQFIDNYFARSDCLADKTPPNYQGTGPDFTGNVLVDVDFLQRLTVPPHPAVPFDPTTNTFATAPHGYDQYERKRWTGRELAMGAHPAP